ncbi:hypothetical protein HDV01_000106 [Terramyces sp. JEL0728]|nr:hypothetical protein HDV01_000106 [Terramyces sp. JEL0728]
MYYIPALITIPKYLIYLEPSDIYKAIGIIALGVPINMILGGLAVYPFLALPHTEPQMEVVSVDVEIEDDIQHTPKKMRFVRKLVSNLLKSYEYLISVLLFFFVVSLLTLYCAPPNSTVEYFSLQFTLLFSLLLFYKSFWKIQIMIFEISPFMSVLFHPTIITTLAGYLFVYLLALITNKSYFDVMTLFFSGDKFAVKHIASYTTVGDVLVYFLNVTVMCLCFPVYAKKKLWVSKFLPLFGGCLLMSVFNLTFIVIVCNLLHVSPGVAKVLVFKNIPTPIAVGDAGFVGAEPGLCGLVSVLSGILGSVLYRFYKHLRFKLGVQLGVSIGSSSHLFGMYALSIYDTESSAFAFLAFVLTAVYYDFALSYINISDFLTRNY